MRAIGFVSAFVAFLALMSLRGVNAQVPKISCTFSADIKLSAVYNYKKHTYYYKQYSIADKVTRKIGDISLGYPGNSSTMIVAPVYYYYFEPFFNRTVCTIVPIKGSLECFELDFDAKLDRRNVSCPADKSRHCDVWSYITELEYYVKFYIYTGTTIPHRVIVQANTYYEQYDFNSFVPEKPDEAIFEVPKDQPCVDLTYFESSTNEKISNTKRHSFLGVRPSSFYNEAQDSKELINDPDRIKALSARKGMTWRAGASKRFEGKTVGDAAKLLRWPGAAAFNKRHRSPGGTYAVYPSTPLNFRGVGAVPEEFDAREVWKYCGIENVQDQGMCSSCWAINAAGTLSDRFCIHGNMTKPFPLSSQYLLSCYSRLEGCNGGFTDIAWAGLVENGTTSEECVPYDSITGHCMSTCSDGSGPIPIYKSKNAYSIYVPFNYNKNVLAIQQEIMMNGPVETT